MLPMQTARSTSVFSQCAAVALFLSVVLLNFKALFQPDHGAGTDPLVTLDLVCLNSYVICISALRHQPQKRSAFGTDRSVRSILLLQTGYSRQAVWTPPSPYPRFLQLSSGSPQPHQGSEHRLPEFNVHLALSCQVNVHPRSASWAAQNK